MNNTPEAGSDSYGWCDTRDAHDGRYDHPRQLTCRNFVSDAELTARLMAKARELTSMCARLYGKRAAANRAERAVAAAADAGERKAA